MSVHVFFLIWTAQFTKKQQEVCVRHPSTGAPAWVKVRDKSSSHCDRSWVAQGKIIQAEH